MELQHRLTATEIFVLCEANIKLTEVSGYDPLERRAQPGPAFARRMADYISELTKQRLLELADEPNPFEPERTRHMNERRQILGGLRPSWHNKPRGADIVEKLRLHCVINAEAAAIIEQDIDRLMPY